MLENNIFSRLSSLLLGLSAAFIFMMQTMGRSILDFGLRREASTLSSAETRLSGSADSPKARAIADFRLGVWHPNSKSRI